MAPGAHVNSHWSSVSLSLSRTEKHRSVLLPWPSVLGWHPLEVNQLHDRATSAFLSTVRTAEHVQDELLVPGSTGYRRLRHKIPSSRGLENPMSSTLAL